MRTTKNSAAKNGAVSEFNGELYRRDGSEEARREFGRVLEALRAEAANTPAAKLSMRQIDAEIAASRLSRKRPSVR
jgi:hypothetical protein